jgi:hypothetical protein
MQSNGQGTLSYAHRDPEDHASLVPWIDTAHWLTAAKLISDRASQVFIALARMCPPRDDGQRIWFGAARRLASKFGYKDDDTRGIRYRLSELEEAGALELLAGGGNDPKQYRLRLLLWNGRPVRFEMTPGGPGRWVPFLSTPVVD